MDPERRNGLNVAMAAVLALAGATVAAQGLGVPIGNGFMVGDLRWTLIGAVALVVAAVVAWRELRTRP